MRAIRDVGRYQILDQIGRGAMAVVHLARQRDLDRLVALKELAPFMGDDGAWAARFLRESRLAGSLSHPHIVTVFDYFEAAGTPFIAMEYMEGGSLRPWVGRMTLPQTFGVLIDVLGGLEHAAGRDIVHRDVKPENLLVTADGGVKIADFGIARAMSALSDGSYHTETGTAVGTPGYMAPEQAMGQDVGPWTDLYALGCVAYELVTGELFFRDTIEPLALLLRHVTEQPPAARDASPEIDESLSDWIARLLIKEPEQRPHSAAAVAAELEEIAIRLAGPRWRRAAALGDRPQDAPAIGPLTGFDTYVPPTLRFRRPPEASPRLPAPPHPSDADEFISWPPVPAPANGGAAPPAPPEPPSALLTPPPPDPLPTSYFTQALALTGFTAPLVAEFEYLHGPLTSDEGGVNLLGNGPIVERLKERLLHSRGGSFLVTGFRGVGKTTVVLRALDELQANPATAVEYLPVVLNVARPMTMDQLLFEVVRRLFEALTDRGVLKALEPDVRHAMLLAYARTSLAFKETTSRSKESSQSLNVDLGKLLPTGVAPKLGLTRKRTDSLAREASFLAYSHSDVEHDFLRIMTLLDGARSGLPKQSRRPWRRGHPPWRGRLVVVLDELDKLTATPEGLAAVDVLLMGLKNLLTARNVHFIFVGGPELHDAFVQDVARGNSVYESVFAYHLYVPGVWKASRRLVDKVVDTDEHTDTSSLDRLVEYFDFKARGMPRLLLRELNGFVRWSGRGAELSIEESETARVTFYGAIQRAVDDFITNGLDAQLRTMEIDEDRWRLGAYYITDWILRRGVNEFTIEEILADEHAPSPLMHASADRVGKLVQHLIGHRIVEKVWYEGVHNVLVSDAEQVESFRLRDDVVEKLAAFAQRNELERAELDGAAGAPWASGLRVRRLKQGRYEVGDLISIGGIGRVHRGMDWVAGREVAVKILAPQYLRDATSRGRWRREAGIATNLRHDHIVRTYEVIEDEQASAIVMELVEGPTLREVLPLGTPAAVLIAAQLLSALEAADEVGLARFDLKPDNIVLRDRRSAVIVDLGLVKPTERDSNVFATAIGSYASGPRIGTPAYMSPEQARGEPVDIRSDVYGVAVVLFEMIAGHHLRDLTASPLEIVLQIATDEADLSALDVSQPLRDALARALARHADDRFATPAEMRDALLETQEGRASTLIGPDELLTPRRRAGARFGVFRASRPATPPPNDAEAQPIER